MSAARIPNRISRLFILFPIAPAIALAAGAGAGPAPAALPLAPARIAGTASPARAAGGASLAASLAASAIRASARPARPAPAAGPAAGARPAAAHSPSYILTAYTRRRGYQAPRRIAWSMMVSFGWPRWQFRFLDQLWECESNWNPQAANPYSGAYGIPQAFPGSKMATAGPDWRWSARTQIRWGLRYIQQRYGSPLGAWSHEHWYGWY